MKRSQLKEAAFTYVNLRVPPALLVTLKFQGHLPLATQGQSPQNSHLCSPLHLLAYLNITSKAPPFWYSPSFYILTIPLLAATPFSEIVSTPMLLATTAIQKFHIASWTCPPIDVGICGHIIF